jgi:hypothetical protein
VAFSVFTVTNLGELLGLVSGDPPGWTIFTVMAASGFVVGYLVVGAAALRSGAESGGPERDLADFEAGATQRDGVEGHTGDEGSLPIKYRGSSDEANRYGRRCRCASTLPAAGMSYSTRRK